ncbi:MAG: cytochrome C biogenesis protein [Rhodothermales bacterium]|nr:cytochrome C biogenesis protein [Rhodothermales bacterium]
MRFLNTIALILLAMCPASFAQAQRSAELVDWVYYVDGGETEDLRYLRIETSIAQDWKMYAMDSPRPSLGVAIRVDSMSTGVSRAGEILQSDPKQMFDPGFQIDVTYFTERATFRIPFSLSDESGESPLAIGRVRYQICNDGTGICLPPTDERFQIVLNVGAEPCSNAVGTDAECEVGDLDLSGLEAAPFDASIAAGSLPVSGSSSSTPIAFLLLAFGAGLAALATPCVFPMIPLTVSYFTKHTESRSESFKMASVFGLAIVSIFTLLGLVMAALVGASGAQSIAANPWVNLFIAGVLIVFALSLLGMYEIRLPSKLVNVANDQGTRLGGYGGVLFMGVTLTLVSFSCTAPFVGGLLAAAAGGEWIRPLTGMLVFSLAFALPFVALAMFPRGLSRLPKSGSWMTSVKVTLGFIELAAAIKFISNADLVWGWNFISRPLAIAFTLVIFALAGLYLLGKLRLGQEESTGSIGVLRMMSALLFFGVAVYMLPGLFGSPLNSIDAYLPPRQATDVSLLVSSAQSALAEEEGWIEDDLDLALLEGQRQGKPVFVDFTGYTCTNCRQMEANVFPVPSVRERFEAGFVLLRLYTDGLERGKEYQRYQLLLTGTSALPTYAIVDPATGDLVTKESGMMKVEKFEAFLDRAIVNYARLAQSVR